MQTEEEMTELVGSDAFEQRVNEMLDMVSVEHKEAFAWIFELGKGVLDAKGAEHIGLITALAINDSVRRRAAEEKKKSRLVRI